MYLKRTLNRSVQRVYLHLKSIGILFWVPVILFNVLVPLLNYLTYAEHGIGEKLYTEILKNSLWYYPFFSNWWTLFLLKEYMEADGNELLFVYAGKIKWWDAFSVFSLSILNIVLWFTVYSMAFPTISCELLRVITICIFYFSSAYLLTFLSRSVLIPLMVLLLYNLGAILNAGVVTIVPVFYIYYDSFSVSLYFQQYFHFFVVACVLSVIGLLLNKKMSRFC